MNLLADEDVESAIVKRCREAGHTVLYIAEMERGIDDPSVLQQANESQSLLITGDKDFGELVFRQELVHRGVILIHLEGLSNDRKATIVVDCLEQHADSLLNCFTVISPGIIRIRKRISIPETD